MKYQHEKPHHHSHLGIYYLSGFGLSSVYPVTCKDSKGEIDVVSQW